MPLDGSHYGEFEKIADAIRVLDRAKALVVKGWARGHWYEAGRYCALGALTRAIVREKLGNHALAKTFSMRMLSDHPAARALGAAVGEGFPGDVATWNDRQKSKAPVLAAFDRAHAALEDQLAAKAVVRG